MSLSAISAATVLATAAPAPQGGFGMLLFPIILIAIMYFLMIRPQMKRQKEHKAMLDKLSRGDEVLTSGGLAGVVTDIGDNFVTVEIADNVRIRVQKPCEHGAGGLVPLDPELPLGAVLVPAGEPLLRRRAHAVPERPLRARVRVHGVLEDRELRPHGRAGDQLRAHGLSGQGRPSAAPRAG